MAVGTRSAVVAQWLAICLQADQLHGRSIVHVNGYMIYEYYIYIYINEYMQQLFSRPAVSVFGR